MENKCLKTQLYMCETLYSENGEIPIDVDFTLPDYCPNVMRILKCQAVSRISSKGVMGKNITVDGSVSINLMYVDDNGKLNSFEYMYPFNKSFETSSELDKAYVYVKSKCEYINCRAITSRKIDIHGAVGVFIKAQIKKCNNVISDYNDKNIELNRKVTSATSFIGGCEKYILIEDEIELGASQQSIHSVVRYDGVPTVKECKILAGKAVVKGEIALNILNCLDDGSMQTTRTVLPFSQMIEIENADEMCECYAKAQIAFLEVKVRTNSAGESKNLQVNCKLLVCCESYRDEKIDVIVDAYSKKYIAGIEKSDVCFSKICKLIKENFIVKNEYDFADTNISSITDMWCDVKTDGVNYDGNNLTVLGTVTSYIIACDTDNQISFYEKQSDFKYTYNFDTDINGMQCEPVVTVTNCAYTITSANTVEVRCELHINATVYECIKMPVVTEISVDENKSIEKQDRGALTIYFASIGESIWDIASRYCSSVEEIKIINDITDDILQTEKMILVPMC